MAILATLLIAWVGMGMNFTANAGQSAGATGMKEFYNPIVDSGADPWVIRYGHAYYMTMTTGSNVTLWKSDTLTGIGNGKQKTVWTPTGTDFADIWAPELHRIGKHWYIYFAADKNGVNATHRMYVLQSEGTNPFGRYHLVGQISDPTNLWAIDGTVLAVHHHLYFIWSGWENETNQTTQNLYIAPMSSPTQISGSRVQISTPTYSWETTVAPINEGPEVLSHAGKVFVVYSANASWMDDYCLGMLTLVGQNPLSPAAWKKSENPVFQSDSQVFGPGHASFTVSPNGKQDWIVYHAARYAMSGWDRNIRAQPFTWNRNGTPNFGKPEPTSQPLPLPSGEQPNQKRIWPVKHGDGVTFRIQVAKPGVYPLWIRYNNGSGIDSSVNLTVNQSMGLAVDFPYTGNWNIDSTAELQLHLNAGINELVFHTTSVGARIPFLLVGMIPQS